MSLPVPNLDNLRFQRDLVDEARKRIVHYCPEWTEYNLSDPGITLIELFAWMTESIIYRLNQVPEKHYIEFLNLLGMEQEPASSARANLTFRLSTSLPIGPDNDSSVIVPAGTEVMSQSAGEEEVVFTTDRQLTVVPPKLAHLRREEDFHKNYLSRLGVEVFYAFDQNGPKEGDAFYLGFDPARDIDGHLLQLSFECERTQAVGVRREDPPWMWECSMGDGRWQEVVPSVRPGERDTTGGLNNPNGSLVLYLPLGMRPNDLHGLQALWLRCSIKQRRPEQGMYTDSPRIRRVVAHTLGATVPATHAVIVEDEMLGTSNGDPGQSFVLEHAPVLALQEDERVEVEEYRDGETVFVPWESVSDFSHSTRFDRHFKLDTVRGEVSFGPAVRQQDGTVRQYGRVPEVGRRVRISQYRRGGGVAGNVPAETLQMMMTSLAYVSRVTNLSRASGGRDGETLDEVKARARRELRAQSRAVTAEDYELFARNSTREVARVKCRTPRRGDGRLAPGTIEILVVPAAADSLKVGDLSRLNLDEGLAKTVGDYLDQFRLLTTVLRIAEPSYLGVRVRVEIVPSDFSQPEVVRERVADRLRAFVSPLPVGADADLLTDVVGEGWQGWPFGRDLYAAEILSLVQRVPGVKHVLDVHISSRPVVPAAEGIDTGESESRESELKAEGRVVHVAEDTLLCSLDHEVVLADLGAEDA